MHADDLLSSLVPEQRQVATALRGPVRVLAEEWAVSTI